MTPAPWSPLSLFLWEVVWDTMTIFVAFFASYLAAATVVLNSAHGNPAAWDTLRDRIHAAIPSSHVQVCKTLNLASIRPTISLESRQRLIALTDSLTQIDGIKRRLLILRLRSRFAMLGILLSLCSGTSLASAILFGFPPPSETIKWFPALVTLLSTSLCTYFIANHHASMWNIIQTRAADAVIQAQEATFEPIN